MIEKYEILNKIGDEKIVAVVRLDGAEQTEKCLQALYEGGIRCAEIPLTSAYSHEILSACCKKFQDKMLIGAGTVLDESSARLAILSGAKFLISPTWKDAVQETGNRYGIPVISGVATATEILHALEKGADVVKLFPAGEYRPQAISDFTGPFPRLKVLPMGGITEKNAKEWLDAGAFALGVSGALIQKAKIGDFDGVRVAAETFCKIVKS